MSSLRDSDPCTDAILDFIASGESAGNYNAVIGDAHSKNDLSVRTVSGIYTLQDHLRSIGRPSTAVGRYQIIKATLQTLVAALNISGSEHFTPGLQDRLAVQLLVCRGYREWWRGDLSNEALAHGLSCEWASLPDPRNGGRSHYDGDSAGNHASTTLNAVYAMLMRARAAMPKPAAK